MNECLPSIRTSVFFLFLASCCARLRMPSSSVLTAAVRRSASAARSLSAASAVRRSESSSWCVAISAYKGRQLSVFLLYFVFESYRKSEIDTIRNC